MSAALGPGHFNWTHKISRLAAAAPAGFRQAGWGGYGGPVAGLAGANAGETASVYLTVKTDTLGQEARDFGTSGLGTRVGRTVEWQSS
jgi:hypothetical protein